MTVKENPKSEVFSFRTENFNIIQKLKDNPKRSDFIEEILNDFFTGKLVMIEDAQKTKDLAELKFRDYKARIILRESQAKIALIHNLQLSPQTAVNILNNKKSVFQATASKEIIQQDKTLRCFSCGKIIEIREYDYMQVDDYEKHVKDDHQRKMYDNEKEQMLKVLGEVEN